MSNGIDPERCAHATGEPGWGGLRQPVTHTEQATADGALMVEAYEAGIGRAVAALIEERDALRAQLDAMWEYAIRADGDSEPFTDTYPSMAAMADEFDGSLAHQDEHVVRRRAASEWVEVSGNE